MEPISFIVIFLIVFVTSIFIQKEYENLAGFLFCMSFLFLFVGLFTPIGKIHTESEPANSIRFEDKILVKSKNFPIQTTSDLKFVDKPLKIIQTSQRNGFGCEIFGQQYTVEIR